VANLHRLGVGATRKIKNAIDDLYDKVKTRLLGPNATGKRIYVTFDRNFSIPGIFESGSYEESVKPDLDILESLIRVTKDYLDASKERTKAKVIHEINGLIAEARHSGGMDRDEFRGVVNTKLTEVWADATNSVHTIIDTEVNHAKNVSVLDGIVGANLHSGVEDPVVYFVVVRDEDLCDECKRLHLLSDGKTPRVWKLSELSHGYHKKGEDSPSIGGLHPHCRCTLVTLMPGYGFTEGGFVSYKKAGYLEYDKQHSLERSEKWLGKTEPFDESKHPRDPESGEFVSQVGHDEMLPSDPEERQRVIDEQERIDQEILDDAASHDYWDDNIENLRGAIEDGVIQPNTQAIERVARSLGIWPEDPERQQAFIRGVLGLSKAEPVVRRIPERKSRKKSDVNAAVDTQTSAPVSRAANKIRNQALAEHAAAGDPPNTALPIPQGDALHLLRAHKAGTNSALAQALRYTMHRITHREKYDDPNTGRELDAKYIADEYANRQRKGAFVKPYGLFDLYSLRRFVALNPKAIQGLMDNMAALHKDVQHAVFDYHGVPSVVLTRGYATPHRLPELALSSWCDLHIIPGKGSSGIHFSHVHYGIVPVSALVHAYHWPKGDLSAHAIARQKPQSELIVMPHDEHDADPAMLKTIFDYVPHATVDEVRAVPDEDRLPKVRYGMPPVMKFDRHAAGALIMAKDTGRVLVGHRSGKVDDPDTWGIWGGTIHPEEDPVLGAHREIKEETGYAGPINFHPIFTHEGPDPTHASLRYHNLLGVVDSEFNPLLNWEHKDSKWVKPSQIPTPTHLGLQALMRHPNLRAQIAQIDAGAARLMRSEEAVGEPLEKSLPTRRANEFTRDVLKPFGWSEPEPSGSGHFKSTHTVSGLNWKGYSKKDRDGAMDHQRQMYFMDQLGLGYAGDGDSHVIGYRPGTPFEAGYRKLGAVSLADAQHIVKLRSALGSKAKPMLLPNERPEPEEFVALHKIHHGLSDVDLKTPNFLHRASQQGPARIPVMNLGGDHVTTNDELLHWARQQGYTHVPVTFVKRGI
jgi:8-oxo-dGTP pyrophosphatase MutT (NUDIX family)